LTALPPAPPTPITLMTAPSTSCSISSKLMVLFSRTVGRRRPFPVNERRLLVVRTSCSSRRRTDFRNCRGTTPSFFAAFP
jgi:hypothetical protein